MRKPFKIFALIVGSNISLIAIIVFIFIRLSPEFGGKATKAEKEIYAQSSHYENGIFINEIETNMDMKFDKIFSTMIDFIKGVPNGRPNSPLKPNYLKIADSIKNTRITWFGHSAFFIEQGEKKILIDPMFGPTPSPISWLGQKRYSNELPIPIDSLPEIDIVFISHDHYDHLDYGSILKLKDKVKLFYTPLGVGVHLRAWGVPAEKIIELNWWEENSYDSSLMVVCAPSRKKSGRGLQDRYHTLWGSWILKIGDENIYFSGDGGYGPHFKRIGEKYGPFDFAMMEYGQYNENWSEIHMMPEETAQASLDLNAKLMMPIHWGAFSLSLHDWREPVERVSIASEKLGINIITPRIGASFELKQDTAHLEKWWRL